MIEGLFFGFIAYLSIVLTWSHSPKAVKNFTRKHTLIADLGASALAYLLISSVSKSIIAAIAAISCGLLINFTLLGAKAADEYSNTKNSSS